MKQPKQNKARATEPGSSKKIACPICGVPFAPGTSLFAHTRFKHGKAAQAQPEAGNKAITTKAGNQEPAEIDPQTHLQTALDQLVARKSEIDQQLGRADAFREEGARLGKRIEALTIAMKAFGPESMAASG